MSVGGATPETAVDFADPALYDGGIPHAAFAELRATPGLAWNRLGDGDEGFWAVARHADVVEVSRDTTTYSSAAGHIQIYTIDDDALEARASMIDMDPPAHTRLRRLVSSAFTPRKIRDYEQAVRLRAGRALDQMAIAGGGDWVDSVAKPIPIGVICDIMGAPAEDHEYLIELSDHLVDGASGNTLPPDAYGNTTDLRLLPFSSPAAHGMSEYARKLGERRRRRPRDDLVTRLVQAEADGERLSDGEFTNFFRLMIFAGNETTRTAMSHLALLLAGHPDQFESIRDDRTAIERAVEEVVRWSSPILYFRRTATRDAVLAGTEVAAGDRVVMWYASANFDEEVFDAPLRFDVGREPNPSVAFGGGGPHFCLGAFLARLELTVLIEELLARQLRLSVASPPRYLHSNFVNGIETLEVRVS